MTCEGEQIQCNGAPSPDAFIIMHKQAHAYICVHTCTQNLYKQSTLHHLQNALSILKCYCWFSSY